TSVAAAALTTPVAAIDFARIAPIGILASIVAVPLAALTVPALFVALAISYVSASVAHFLAGGCQLLLASLDSIAGAAASISGGHTDVAPPVAWMWSAAVIVALIAMSELAPFRRGREGRASGSGLS